MNSKIKELMKEADLTPYYTQQETAIVKLAELVVKECLRMGREIQEQNVRNASEGYNDGRQMGIEVFMNQISHEFGIE